jgi:hypothetical protein|nr:MAG TPA: tail completion protein [Caudoviricetes sp.]
MLKQLNIPVAYQSFKQSQRLPYIIFVQSGSNNFGADCKVYHKDNKYNIELYFEDKDFALEEKLEDLLDENDIYWTKSADIRIESENMTEVIYYI